MQQGAIHLRDNFFITTGTGKSIKGARVSGLIEFMSEEECKRYVAGSEGQYVDYGARGGALAFAKQSLASAIRAAAGLTSTKTGLKEVKFTIFTSDK